MTMLKGSDPLVSVMTVRHGDLAIEWLGYATVRLETTDGSVGYTDPGRYGVVDDYWEKDGDFVVVTHDHHYDPAGIRSVADSNATLIIYESVTADHIERDVDTVDELAAEYEVIRVSDNDCVTIDGVTIWTVEAYNDPEGPNADEDGTVTHPPGLGCGFTIAMGAQRVFWMGDSDALDGFAELDVSVFLANIGGGGIVANRQETAELAEAMQPELVIPVHYDTLESLTADDEAFAADVASRSIPVALDHAGVNH